MEETSSSSALSLISDSITILDPDGNEIKLADLPRVVGFYFGSAWSPACTTFHPVLVNSSRVHIQKQSLAIVYVSADRTEDGYEAMLADTQFLRVPFPMNLEVSNHFKITRKSLGLRNLPNLVIFDMENHVILSVDAASDLSVYGSLLFDSFVHHNDPWQYWKIGIKMLYVSFRQFAVSLAGQMVGLFVAEQRLIGGPFQSTGRSIFREILGRVFGRSASTSSPTTPSPSRAAGELEEVPPTIEPNRLNMDDSEEGDIFADTMSIFSSKTSKSVQQQPEDFKFPFPNNDTTISGLRTPPPSPIPILKRPNFSSSNLMGDSMASSALSMSTVSLGLEASMLNLSESMRRESVYSTGSPDASVINLSESMMSEFRTSRGGRDRKVSFSQDVAGNFDQYMAQSGRKSISDSMVVIERGIWDDDEEYEKKDN